MNIVSKSENSYFHSIFIQMIITFIFFVIPTFAIAETNTAKESEKKYGFVIDSTYILSGPNNSFSIIKKALPNEVYEYTKQLLYGLYDESYLYSRDPIEHQDYDIWYEVVFSGNRGWINGTYFLTCPVYIDDNGNDHSLNIRDISDKNLGLQNILHGGYYSIVNYHYETGFGAISDIWLISRDWKKRKLIIQQKDLGYGDINWSVNDKYLLIGICNGNEMLFDIDKMKFTKTFDAYGQPPVWTKDNKILFFKDFSHLYKMNPKTLRIQLMYDFGGFTIVESGNCSYVCGDAPGYSSFEKDKGVMKIIVFSPKEEVWEFSFDTGGVYKSRKKITTCIKWDRCGDWQN